MPRFGGAFSLEDDMGKTVYVNADPDVGHDSNTGARWMTPKRTLAAALASIDPSSRVVLCGGQVHEQTAGLALKTPQTVLTAADDGPPLLRLARGKGVCLTVSAPVLRA